MMKPPPDQQASQRMAQAAGWLQRLQAPADDGTLEQWLDWCTQDPRNQRAFDDISQVWAASAQVPASPPRRPSPRALAAGIAGLFTLLLAGAAGWNTWRQQQAQLPVMELAANAGSNSRTELPDGSIVELGGRSQARVHYTSAQRQLSLLHGQLFVTVSSDAGRPFVVNVGELRIKAVGTAFDVLNEAGRSVVTVVEGQVEVRTAAGGAADQDAATIRLGAGQQLVQVAGSGALPERIVDTATATAWRSGVLIFVDQPLIQVLAAVNRYADREVIIEDPQVGAALAFTGTARTDRIGNWLAALPDTFPVVLQPLPDGRLLLQGRPGNTAGPSPLP